jgi:mannosyl-oligosaccharide alpha-1,2-mannosidase
MKVGYSIPADEQIRALHYQRNRTKDRLSPLDLSKIQTVISIRVRCCHPYVGKAQYHRQAWRDNITSISNMLSLRRYAVYLGIATCLLLLLATFYRRPIIDRIPAPIEPISKSGPTGPGRIKGSNQLSDPNFKWNQVPVRYPVRKLTPIPTAKPKRLPRVQFDFASQPETAERKKERKGRQNAVKQAFERCWKAYRSHAWKHDELAPISEGVRDGFGGWAASLVDNLDNLWIMDMKSDFEDAVQAAMEIDLRKCSLEQINVFETTIRHLGGLLSAYDLSGDERLLTKAREFGDMLIVAFDTPNRMPITRWFWHMSLRQPQEADNHVLVAEIGSLTMEFTRLSLLTGEPKWYDAVERIIAHLSRQQFKTLLPGMWPVSINAAAADFTDDTLFTLSAMSDSLYEYFPKMHALLGGVDPRYEKLYSGSMATAIEYNLWRPMTLNNDDILISGNVRKQTAESEASLQPQGQHLVCFAGGMFALGGKLFHQPAHVDIGKKLTNGCIYTYKAMPLGIMPEVFYMVPCESRVNCEWNETLWKASVLAENRDTSEEADVDTIINSNRLPPGFTNLKDRRYLLRPEAIESVFVLYRITGETTYQDTAWEMFSSIMNATKTDLANAALRDISFTREDIGQGEDIQMDSMESFWMAETLKYFYLIFSDPDVVDLDEWVFNTEAHPLKRRLPE